MGVCVCLCVCLCVCVGECGVCACVCVGECVGEIQAYSLCVQNMKIKSSKLILFVQSTVFVYLNHTQWH